MLGLGVQHLELHTVPDPALAGQTAARGLASKDDSQRACGHTARTDSAPPAWSLSLWLITTASGRSPSARNSGTTTRSPASLSTP
jgi:hypothetical protein